MNPVSQTKARAAVLLCTHCGEPCQDTASAAESLHFCCNGCRTVYGILAEKDLCAYYAFDEQTSDRRRPTSTADFEILDSPTAAARLITSRSDTRVECVFSIPGMHCASCVWLLERLHRIDAGVYESTVDLTRKTVRITFNPKHTSIRAVAELLAALNFEPNLQLSSEDVSSRNNKPLLVRLGIAGFASVNVMMFSIAAYLAGEKGLSSTIQSAFEILSVILSVPVFVYAASPWWTSAWRSIRKGAVNLDVPVAIGIAVIFTRSYVDIVGGNGQGFLDAATGLVFFLLLGRLIQEKAFAAISFDRTVRSFFPLGIRVQQGKHFVQKPIETLTVGDIVELRNGEVLPCEAVLLSTTAYLDYAFVTGESTPHVYSADQRLMSGGRVVGSAIRCAVTSEVRHGHLADMWERTSARRPRTRLLDISARFGAGFTAVTALIAITAFVFWLPNVSGAMSVLTAVLIIACPCALTLAAPMALGTAMGLLGKRGIMVRNTGTLLELDAVTHVVFDKTGTLTQSHRDAVFVGETLTPLQREAVAAVVAQSTHPVSRAIAEAMGHAVAEAISASHGRQATNVEEIVGGGVVGQANGYTVSVGSSAWIYSNSAGTVNNAPPAHGTLVSIDGCVVGKIVMKERLREGAEELVGRISKSYRTSLFSGDTRPTDALFHNMLVETDLHFGMQPEDKTSAVIALQRGRETTPKRSAAVAHQHCGETVLMIGDGLNDAGAMNAANVAIAVSNDNATIVPACDVIVSGAHIGSILPLLRYARSIRNVIITTFTVSVVYNAIGLTLAVTGALSPLAVAVLMPVSSLTVIGLAIGGARYAMRRQQWK